VIYYHYLSLANSCYHLWDFIRDILADTNSTSLAWINKANEEFRIMNTKELSKEWGKLKNSSNMTYDKLSRSLRYYCELDILEKIPGTRLQFRFGKKRTWAGFDLDKRNHKKEMK